MVNDSGIIHAFTIDGKGSGSSLSGIDNIAEHIENEHLAWAHFDANDANTKTWLEKELDFLDEIIVQALVADETRPRILQFEHGTLLISAWRESQPGRTPGRHGVYSAMDRPAQDH